MKKFMKKYRDLLIVLGVLLVVIGGTYFLSKLAENKDFKEITFEKYEELVKKKDELFVYIGSSKDEESLETVRSFAKENNLSFKYILDKDLTDKQKEKLGYESNTIIYSIDGISESYTGEIDSTNIRKFFVNLEVLPKTYVTIGIEEYLKMVNTENFIVFVAREGCGYCDQYKPIVNEVMAENDVMIYQLDITNFAQEDYEKMYTTASYFTDEKWGTPTTLIFSNGTVKDVLGGYVDATGLVDFLKTNGVM